MEQYPERLNGIFQALADPTRRAVLGRLGRGPASISDLAKPFDMALPSFMKHIHLLEESGWIRTRKQGRVRTCAIEKKPFAAVEAWLSEQRALWEGRTDRLEQFVTSAAEKGKIEMTRSVNPDLDLTISRIIKAPRQRDLERLDRPASFEQWWVPAPAKCKVVEMDLRPGGAFVTQISENGGDFAPHLSACFLAVDERERIVFTDALVGGWRPAEQPFMTAIITLKDHPTAPTTSPT